MISRIKIFGASNCGNVGDDLIGIILTKYLQSYFPNANVSLIPQHHRHEIQNSDIIIIGGGGLIYDYEMDNVRNYCDIIHAAYAYRIPVYLMGMGVQHVFSQEAKNIYTDAFKLVRRIVTRGAEDTAFIGDTLIYPRKRLTTSRDLVFLYDDVFQSDERDNAFKSETTKPTLALSLADWRLGDNYKKINAELQGEYDVYRAYIKDNLSKLASYYDVKVVCQAKEDIELSKEMVEMIEGAELITFDSLEDSLNLVSVYRGVDYVITNRYHGLIASIIADTPTLGVSFNSHKQQRLIDESFPSLKDQFYTIKDFVGEDIIGKMLTDEFRGTLVSADRGEYKKCVSLARRHVHAIKNISADLAKV